MKLNRLTIKDVLRFTAPVTLDLSTLPPGLIAVVGKNGEGKSTILESAIAALYRTFPSRADQELVSYATSRDAYLEAVYTIDGGTYRARVCLDGPKRATSAVLELTTPDGTRQLVSDGKVSTFDAAVAERFPALSVLLASAVASQNRAGSFATLDKRGRKDLFSALLGLDHYEQLAQTARQVVALHETARTGLLAQQEALARDGAASVGEAIDAARVRLTSEHEAQVALLADAQSDRAALRAARDRCAEDAARHALALERMQALSAETAALFSRETALSKDYASTRAAAVAERKLLDDQLASRRADLEQRVANNRALSASGDAIREAVTHVAQARERLQAQTALRDQRRAEADERRDAMARARVDVLAAEQAARDLDRAERAVTLLGTVPCGGADPYGGCSFLADARAAQASVPALRTAATTLDDRRATLDAWTRDDASAQADRRALDDAIAALTTELKLHEQVASRLPQLEATETRIGELQADLVELDRRHEADVAAVKGRCEAAISQIVAGQNECLTAHARVAKARQAVVAERDATSAAAGELSQIVLRLSDLDETVERATAAIASCSAQLEEVARQDTRWRETRQRLSALAQEQRHVDDEVREWGLLAKACGRDGLPVLEIDAAGPTVSALCNDLLTVCFGPRFTVELITQAEKADGKGTKEVFDLRVYDNLRGGAPRDLSDLSGGEQVLVDEALKNALALFVNRRHVGAIRTCWRDETTGPLDPENARRYIDMLRRVQHLGGFDHTLFVSHNVEAAALADVQVRVADGALTVCFPPFAEAA